MAIGWWGGEYLKFGGAESVVKTMGKTQTEIKVGQKVVAHDDGHPYLVTVEQVIVIPFGTTLDVGWMDATAERERKAGIRVGVKGPRVAIANE